MSNIDLYNKNYLELEKEFNKLLLISGKEEKDIFGVPTGNKDKSQELKNLIKINKNITPLKPEDSILTDNQFKNSLSVTYEDLDIKNKDIIKLLDITQQSNKYAFTDFIKINENIDLSSYNYKKVNFYFFCNYIIPELERIGTSSNGYILYNLIGISGDYCTYQKIKEIINPTNISISIYKKYGYGNYDFDLGIDIELKYDNKTQIYTYDTYYTRSFIHLNKNKYYLNSKKQLLNIKDGFYTKDSDILTLEDMEKEYIYFDKMIKFQLYMVVE